MHIIVLCTPNPLFHWSIFSGQLKKSHSVKMGMKGNSFKSYIRETSVFFLWYMFPRNLSTDSTICPHRSICSSLLAQTGRCNWRCVMHNWFMWEKEERGWEVEEHSWRSHQLCRHEAIQVVINSFLKVLRL